MALQTLRLLNFFDDPSLPEGLHGHAPWSAVLSPPLLFPVLSFNHRTPQVGRLVDRLRQVSMPAITNQWCNFSAKLKWSDTQDLLVNYTTCSKLNTKLYVIPPCTPKNKAILAYRTIRFTSGRCLYRSFTASRYSCFLRSRGRSCKRQDICWPSHTRLVKRNVNKLSPRDPAQLMILFFP